MASPSQHFKRRDSDAGLVAASIACCALSIRMPQAVCSRVLIVRKLGLGKSARL